MCRSLQCSANAIDSHCLLEGCQMSHCYFRGKMYKLVNRMNCADGLSRLLPCKLLTHYFLKFAGCVLQVAYSSQSAMLFLSVCFFFNMHSTNPVILQNPSENPPAFREAVLRTHQFLEHARLRLTFRNASNPEQLEALFMKRTATK